MPLPISVVIIARNEEKHIVACIASANRISTDIVVVDTGSTDNTVKLASDAGARVITAGWQGYGAARNAGAAAALNHWVFSLDADERIGSDTVEILERCVLDAGIVYKFRRLNHWQKKAIRFGAYGFDRIARLYHRDRASWNSLPVHERLTGNFREELLPASILHFGISDPEGYDEKKTRYARLCAFGYRLQGRKASGMRRLAAPFFDAFKSYVLLAGFLDGVVGWKLAQIIFRYTRNKYTFLAKAQPEPASGISRIDPKLQVLSRSSAAS